jgi:plasmid stabilization system protein ParE
MTPRLALRPQAERDVEQAVRWYEGERSGLGVRFLHQLDGLFKRIQLHPFQFPEIQDGVRRGLLSRFPYGVYFAPAEDEIVVLAVLHLYRHPDTWKNR